MICLFIILIILIKILVYSIKTKIIISILIKLLFKNINDFGVFQNWIFNINIIFTFFYNFFTFLYWNNICFSSIISNFWMINWFITYHSYFILFAKINWLFNFLNLVFCETKRIFFRYWICTMTVDTFFNINYELLWLIKSWNVLKRSISTFFILQFKF